MKILPLSTRVSELSILFLFLCSGFSGLIYESIWSHYLKLIFGHAAYAQSLVLGIFMGGLALGAYLASRLNNKITNPLLTYAVVEAIIGVFALFFHEIFIFTQNLLFTQIAPNVNSTILFSNIKWLLGIILILPQSILLGTTFPLISKGLLMLSPQQAGKKISLLYFNNSFGAAIGALFSGFFLIQHFGLPGTILSAGLINIVIAIIVIVLIKTASTPQSLHTATPHTIDKDRLYYLMLGTAFFTGLASFFYEIAWIRMLTLLLGATTHAFELMLSAFILGLALGSLWIKKRIDQFKSPIEILGYVQLLMATFALATLVFYDNLFDVMEYIFKSLNRSEEGYGIYMLVNHILALIVMLPATFFAGMTLPLVTTILLQRSNNEKIIGQVYATNTLGSIIGIVVAMNLLLPLTGTKGLVSLGGLVDLTIGISLFGYIYFKEQSHRLKYQFILTSVFSVFIFQIIQHTNIFNPLKTSSGVFRSGIAKHTDGTKVLFHKDGKLSTVDVLESPDGNIAIVNNGKPDAGINLYSTEGGPDEVTMILLGALPVAINSNIKTVANIGVGSGQTVQTLLSYNFIEQVDSLEIEEGVIEALPAFKIYSQHARYNKRSNIIIDDAKSFFSATNKKFDLIVSEPPNPWVSGVASLFTKEFYSHIKQSITSDGFLTQWLHLYEINIDTISSIIKAVSENFSHYALYNTDERNIIIIASNKNLPHEIDDTFLSSKEASLLLKRIKIDSTDSIRARYIGNKDLLDPLFSSYKTKAASDYFPQLSYAAGKSLFLQDSAVDITSLQHYPIPVNQILMGTYPVKTLSVLNEKHYIKSTAINVAKKILNDFSGDRKFDNLHFNQQLQYTLRLLTNRLFHCKKSGEKSNFDDRFIIESAYQLVKVTSPYLGKDDLSLLWKKIQSSPCYKNIVGPATDWLSLYQNMSNHQFDEVLKTSQKLLANNYRHLVSSEINEYLVVSTLVSAIQTNNIKLAQTLWEKFSPSLMKNKKQMPLSLRLLLAHLNNNQLH